MNLNIFGKRQPSIKKETIHSVQEKVRSSINELNSLIPDSPKIPSVKKGRQNTSNLIKAIQTMSPSSIPLTLDTIRQCNDILNTIETVFREDRLAQESNVETSFFSSKNSRSELKEVLEQLSAELISCIDQFFTDRLISEFPDTTGTLKEPLPIVSRQDIRDVLKNRPPLKTIEEEKNESIRVNSAVRLFSQTRQLLKLVPEHPLCKNYTQDSFQAFFEALETSPEHTIAHLVTHIGPAITESTQRLNMFNTLKREFKTKQNTQAMDVLTSFVQIELASESFNTFDEFKQAYTTLFNVFDEIEQRSPNLMSDIEFINDAIRIIRDTEVTEHDDDSYTYLAQYILETLELFQQSNELLKRAPQHQDLHHIKDSLSSFPTFVSHISKTQVVIQEKVNALKSELERLDLKEQIEEEKQLHGTLTLESLEPMETTRSVDELKQDLSRLKSLRYKEEIRDFLHQKHQSLLEQYSMTEDIQNILDNWPLIQNEESKNKLLKRLDDGIQIACYFKNKLPVDDATTNSVIQDYVRNPDQRLTMIRNIYRHFLEQHSPETIQAWHVTLLSDQHSIKNEAIVEVNKLLISQILEHRIKLTRENQYVVQVTEQHPQDRLTEDMLNKLESGIEQGAFQLPETIDHKKSALDVIWDLQDMLYTKGDTSIKQYEILLGTHFTHFVEQLSFFASTLRERESKDKTSFQAFINDVIKPELDKLQGEAQEKIKLYRHAAQELQDLNDETVKTLKDHIYHV